MAKKQQPHSDAADKSVFLPIELITEVLSLLGVKDIMRLRCVCKSWNNLTYDSNFVDKHLKVSSRNPHLTLSWFQKKPKLTNNVVPFPVHRLYKESSATVSSDDFHRMTIEIRSWVVGSCNGLLFFLSRPLLKCIFYISNPATRTRSRNFEFPFGHKFSFTLGYDASTRTYKVVAFRAELEYSEVKVFNLGDKYCWRNIQNFPLVPHNRLDLHHYYTEHWLNNGVHFYGTINWLALDKSINGIYRFVIVSLDLSTETYKQFLPPTLGCDHMAIYKPTLRVLMDSLCFSHEDSNKTKFILWKMKEYGVEESWTQLFEISYQNLAMQLPNKLSTNNIDYGIQYRLVCLYVNGDIAIFASGRCCKEAFFYNLKDKTVVKMIESKHYIYRVYDSKDYVESLVSVY